MLPTQEFGLKFAILGRGSMAFQIEKIGVVNPLFGNLDIEHNYMIFGRQKHKLAITHNFASKNFKEK